MKSLPTLPSSYKFAIGQRVAVTTDSTNMIVGVIWKILSGKYYIKLDGAPKIRRGKEPKGLKIISRDVVEVEKNLIFPCMDSDKFVHPVPYYKLEITTNSWTQILHSHHSVVGRKRMCTNFLQGIWKWVNVHAFHKELKPVHFKSVSMKAYADWQDSTKTIRVNNLAPFTYLFLMTTVAHEMCHQYVHQKNLDIGNPHGDDFQRIARKVSEKLDITISTLVDINDVENTELETDNFDNQSVYQKPGFRHVIGRKPLFYLLMEYVVPDGKDTHVCKIVKLKTPKGEDDIQKLEEGVVEYAKRYVQTLKNERIARDTRDGMEFNAIETYAKGLEHYFKNNSARIVNRPEIVKRFLNGAKILLSEKVMK